MLYDADGLACDRAHADDLQERKLETLAGGRYTQRCLPSRVYCVAQRKTRRCVPRRCRWRQVRRCPVIVCMATRSGSCPGFWTRCSHSNMTSSCDSYTPGRMTCTQSAGCPTRTCKSCHLCWRPYHRIIVIIIVFNVVVVVQDEDITRGTEELVPRFSFVQALEISAEKDSLLEDHVSSQRAKISLVVGMFTAYVRRSFYQG